MTKEMVLQILRGEAVFDSAPERDQAMRDIIRWVESSEQVVHANWMEHNYPMDLTYSCSNCKYTYYRPPNHGYCPECGALMGGIVFEQSV